jgi:hypothetical protein
MRTALVILLLVHGSIHLIGFVEAFDLADVSVLSISLSPGVGLLWLVASAGFVTSAVLGVVAPSSWWVAAAPALVLSQLLILTAWSDARYGTLVNVALLLPLASSLLELRASSLSSIYANELRRRLRPVPTEGPITAEELLVLPPQLQTYLRRSGVVHRPPVHDFRARFSGEMRNGAKGSWMKVHVEQVNLLDDPARIFLMSASLHGAPLEALHVYANGSATMRVRVASLFDVVDARGREMNQSETVTLFNDMCILAPGALLRADVTWTEVDARTVSAVFSNAGNTITAELSFDAAGDLVGFASNDRYRSEDGKTYEKLTWSTPIAGYREFQGRRIAALGTAMWKEPEGDFEYAHFVLDSIEYNVAPRPKRNTAPGFLRAATEGRR